MVDINIRLYAADVSCLESSKLYNKALSVLDEERRARAERIKNEAGARLSAGAGLLMKNALTDIRDECGIMVLEDDGSVRVKYGDNGKPYLEGRQDIFFNLSHSGNIVICAIAPCEVGCDIERIRPGRGKIAERYFSEEERFFAGLSERNFFRMWTLKESFMKVTGKGLSLPLDSFSISIHEGENASSYDEPSYISVRQNVDERSYIFREYSVSDGYCCSVCAAGEAVFEPQVRNCDISIII